MLAELIVEADPLDFIPIAVGLLSAALALGIMFWVLGRKRRRRHDE